MWPLQLLLAAAGLVLLWRFHLSPAARKAPPALAPWSITPLEVLFFAWLAIIGGLVTQFAVASLPTVRALADYQRTLLASGALLGGMIIGVYIFSRRFPGRFAPNTPTSASPATPLPANILTSGLITFLISLPLVYLVGFISSIALKAAGLPLEKQLAVDLFRTIDSPPWLALLCFLPVVVAPISEELIFRAGFFRYLRTRLPRWAALALPACVFAAAHGNLASFFPLATLGIVFSLAYERTGRIGTAMVAHALFNLHTVLFLLAGVQLGAP